MVNMRKLPVEMIGQMAAGVGGVMGGEWVKSESQRRGYTWFSPDPRVSGRYLTMIAGTGVALGGIIGYMTMKNANQRYGSSLIAFGGSGMFANGLNDLIMNPVPATSVRAVPTATVRSTPAVSPREKETVIAIQ